MGSSWTQLDELGLLNFGTFNLAARLVANPLVVHTNQRVDTTNHLLLILNPDPDQPLISSQLPALDLNSPPRFPYGYAVED